MIKSFILILLLITGYLCRVIPDDDDDVPVPKNIEEQTKAVPSGEDSKAANPKNTGDEDSRATKPENTQEISNKEGTSNSEGPKETEESKSAVTQTSEENPIETRSAEENSKESATKTDKAAVELENSETSEASTKADDINGSGGVVTRTSRNSEENYSPQTEVISAEHDSASPGRSGGSIETETAERDDASHIHTKEQAKQAPEEENVELDESSQRSLSEEDSKPESVEQESKMVSDAESNSASPDMRAITASTEIIAQDFSDDDPVNEKSDTEGDMGVEGLFNSDTAAPGDPITRRMLDQNSEDSEKLNSSEGVDARMAPREDPLTSGHQVHSNNFDSSRAGQSQYPFSPLEDSSFSPIRSFPFSKEASSLPNFFSPVSKLHQPMSWQNGHSFISSPNSQHLKPLSLHQPLDLNESLRPLPRLPPLAPNKPLSPLPPLPLLEPNGLLKPLQFPLEHHLLQDHPPPQQQLKPSPSWNSNPVFENWQPQQIFQRLLPPLPPLNSMPTLNPFKPLQNNVNMFSSVRQAMPETSQPSTFYGTWRSEFQTSPMTGSSIETLGHF